MSRFILASSSPRRRELLGQLNLSFEVVNPNVEEVIREGETSIEYVVRNAKLKFNAVVESLAGNDAYILAADTVVVVDDDVLEKPHDKDEARGMLARLSGRCHRVITGVSVGSSKNVRTFYVETEVEFKKNSEGEIRRYVDSGEPMDKAGAYAAQGNGAYFVRSIRGSYTNVVGLPMAELCDALDELGIEY